MRISRNTSTRRELMGLGLAGLLAAAVGCDSTNDVTQSVSQEDNPGLARQKARQEAFGKTGAPTTSEKKKK